MLHTHVEVVIPGPSRSADRETLDSCRRIRMGWTSSTCECPCAVAFVERTILLFRQGYTSHIHDHNNQSSFATAPYPTQALGPH